jgi:hypothetical protein
VADQIDAVDAIVRDPRLAPYCGWHDEQPGGDVEYQPAIQQDRAEFLAFLHALPPWVFDYRALTLGLGIAGGMHLVFDHLFRLGAVTIDNHWSSIQGFLKRDLKMQPWSTVCEGRFASPTTIELALSRAPYSLLFIDGTHSYDEVGADFQNYAPMVMSGGVVAFHDVSAAYPEVMKFVDELRQTHEVKDIEPHRLGIAWLTR